MSEQVCKNCENCITKVTPAGPVYYCKVKPKQKGADGEGHLYMVQGDNRCEAWGAHCGKTI